MQNTITRRLKYFWCSFEQYPTIPHPPHNLDPSLSHIGQFALVGAPEAGTKCFSSSSAIFQKNLILLFLIRRTVGPVSSGFRQQKNVF